MFYKILLESFMIDALGYRSCLEKLDAWMAIFAIVGKEPWGNVNGDRVGY